MIRFSRSEKGTKLFVALEFVFVEQVQEEDTVTEMSVSLL